MLGALGITRRIPGLRTLGISVDTPTSGAAMLGPTMHNDALQLSRIPASPGNTGSTVLRSQRSPPLARPRSSIPVASSHRQPHSKQPSMGHTQTDSESSDIY